MLLWTVDNITTSTGSGSGAATSLTSASANPASTGVIRFASSDVFCFRNNANSANLCVSKDSSDRLIWAGLSFFITEGACPAGIAAQDGLCADSTNHRFGMLNNGGSEQLIVGQSTTDTLVNKTLDTAAPNTLKIAGTQITAVTGAGNTVCISGAAGCSLTSPALTTPTIGSTTITNVPQMAWSAKIDSSLLSPPAAIYITNSPIQIKDFTLGVPFTDSGCSTFSVWSIYDETAASALSSITIAVGVHSYTNTGLSINVASGHTLDIRLTTNPIGCTNTSTGTATMQYIMQ